MHDYFVQMDGWLVSATWDADTIMCEFPLFFVWGRGGVVQGKVYWKNASIKI
jgi:hypothetical protein